MHTVIILSKHSSDLLREYRYLFNRLWIREPLASVTGMNPEQTLKRLSRICTNRSEEKLTGGL